MRRREVLAAASAIGVTYAQRAAAVSAPSVVAGARALRFGTTPVFLDDQVGFLSRWAAYLTDACGMPVRFVQRRAYRDIMGMLRSEELDAAWICGYPWVVNQSVLQGISSPTYEGGPWYRSYLIVNAHDTMTKSFRDLAGKVYAYSDPDSNSGCLVPRATMIRAGLLPEQLFSRSFYTWGHRNVVTAVSSGLAYAGSVDGYVWDTLKRSQPRAVEQTRIAWRSDPYGFPPVAARASLPAEDADRLRTALSSMGNDAAGQRLLAELNLSAFGKFEPTAYAGIAKLVSISGARAS
jgi:phosphonate transport system substrate-binding protein